MKNNLILLGLIVYLAGCTGPSDTPPLPLQVLAQTRQLLEGSDFQAHALSIGGKMTLAVWYVLDREDSWLAEAEARFPFSPGPDRPAFQLMATILESVPQAQEAFEIFNPMIVLPDHSHGMLDMIPWRVLDWNPGDLPSLVRQFQKLETRMPYYFNSGSYREYTPQPNSGWGEAREEILRWLEGENKVIYRIVGASGDEYRLDHPTVYVQFQTQIPQGASPQDARSRVAPLMVRVMERLLQTSPKPVRLESFWVDSRAITRFYARLEGDFTPGESVPFHKVQIRSISPLEPH